MGCGSFMGKTVKSTKITLKNTNEKREVKKENTKKKSIEIGHIREYSVYPTTPSPQRCINRRRGTFPSTPMLGPLTINTSSSTSIRPNYSSSSSPKGAEAESNIKSKRKRSFGSKPSRRKMWFMHVFDEEKKELGRQQAPGSCPYCQGKVEAMDVEIQWRLCFLPMCFKIKRKFFCTSCARRLELYY